MKQWLFRSFRSFNATKITLIAWAIIITGLTATVVALTNQQNMTVASEIQRYKDDIARLHLSDAQAVEYYGGVRTYLQNVVDMNLAILAGIPGWNIIGNTGATTPTPPSSIPQCTGIAPTWSNVIKSISISGMVGSDTWNYVTNTKWMSADLGMSCLWTCEPGYTKNGNICMLNTVSQWSSCVGSAPSWSGVIKSTSVFGMVDNTWNYVTNTKWMSTDLGLSCQWTCATGYTRNGNMCMQNTVSQWSTCVGSAPSWAGVIKSTSVFGMVDNTWNYVANTKGMSTDLGLSCQWTCATGYTRNGNNWCMQDPQAQCTGTAPTGSNIIKSTSVFGMVDNTWNYVANTKGMSTDLGLSCQWTCEPGYIQNGNICVTNASPKTVYTDSSFTVEKTTISVGDTLYGYVVGWTKDDLWGCIDIPGGNDCMNNKWWRQLTKSYYDPITARIIQDGWQSNPNHNGRVELQSWFYIAPGYPLGKYTGYTRTWLTGTPQSTSFTVIDRVKSCSWWATIGPCDPGVCSTSNIWAQACGGTCTCN